MDLIDRAKIVYRCELNEKDRTNCLGECETCSKRSVSIKDIRKLESIEATKSKYGEWLFHWYELYECGACHKRNNRPSVYCPDCGAKMSLKEGVKDD